MIVSSRFKAREDQAITTAWFGERFARLKKVRPLEKYLKRTAKPTPEQGAADLRAMIQRMAAKGG